MTFKWGVWGDGAFSNVDHLLVDCRPTSIIAFCHGGVFLEWRPGITTHAVGLTGILYCHNSVVVFNFFLSFMRSMSFVCLDIKSVFFNLIYLVLRVNK